LLIAGGRHSRPLSHSHQEYFRDFVANGIWISSSETLVFFMPFEPS
jgi:hypothetical protein